MIHIHRKIDGKFVHGQSLSMVDGHSCRAEIAMCTSPLDLELGTNVVVRT